MNDVCVTSSRPGLSSSFFSLPLGLAKASSTTVCRTHSKGPFCLHPDLKGKAFSVPM